MSEIVKTVSRIFSPLIFLFGIYITIHGHLTPGGGFAGGVIIAGAIILEILARGSDEIKLVKKEKKTSIVDALGILLFWLMAFLGLIVSGIFFLNFIGNGIPFYIFSAGIIPLCNIGIALEVAGSVTIIVLALILFETGSPER